MTYKPEKGSRQPIVLYDKDNKAIDVSGIKELPSIKIDTGKIAGDLKLVKDNQGRLYGKYGEAWIPVKVDSEGRPIISSEELATELTLAQILTTLGGTAADIGTLKLENGQIKGYDGTDWQPVRVNDAGELILASEVTVNAEGLSVDLGKLVLQAKNPSGVPVDMKSDTEGNLKVSLSGTKTTETSLHNRLIRTYTRVGDVVNVPDGARGAYVYLIIHGVTGTFAEGEGARLRVYLFPPAPSSLDAVASIITAVSAQKRSQFVVIDKGSSLGEIVPWTEGRIAVSGLGLCPGSRMRCDIVINGTFADGEGIDCEVLIKWIYS